MHAGRGPVATSIVPQRVGKREGPGACVNTPGAVAHAPLPCEGGDDEQDESSTTVPHARSYLITAPVCRRA